ncbi:hypothetical protein HU200_033954 [Digitaria exilis]|uniref:NB-ARC domain-containing protein n=1 Tax=Digitaria exilis TaxID=1010633 RepID=A0A835BWB5_9POAL|nr:hypothetical protein HU200_033954 [Digitaria exilis]
MGSRQYEFETLKNRIMNKEGNISHRAVISLLGERGIGKTTLAKKLYNDPDIMKHFEVHAWVCLPPHIRFSDYVETMYTQVSSQVPEVSGDGEITNKELMLTQNLQNRTYLVVLDGLISISDWNSLFDVLPDTNGSRILLTTHLNVKEINHIDPQTAPIELPYFDMKHGEQLFCQRVFGGKAPPQTFWSKGYYEKVHNISTGLPLAIAVIAGVLRSKVMPMEWDNIFEQLESNGQPKPVRSIWSLAFDDLPHYLKSCFLYFASVSENVILYPDRLVRLWIAEGFVVPKKAETLEDVGFDYLKELVSRGFLRVIDLNGLKMQKLPDEIGSIIHLRYLGIRNSNLEELPSSMSKLDNLQTLDVRRTNVGKIVDEFWEIEALRHVLAEKMLLPNCSVPLNNLMTLNGVVPSDLWGEKKCPLNNMIYLRSLSLSSISAPHTTALSDALRKLEYLVYLNLSGEVLPSNMFTATSMRRLQVLILHGNLEGTNDLLGDRYVLPNLTVLHLHKSELSQQFVDKLALLPCLAEMELLDISYSETTMSFHDGFPSLTNLKLKEVSTLQKLVIGRGVMPMLSILGMYDCESLKTLKALNDLEHLQEVAVYKMPEIIDNIKLEDEKLFRKIKNLTTPMITTDRVFPGYFRPNSTYTG